MNPLPDRIDTVEELEDVLSTPSDKLVEFMKALDGDIMILGAGGKIGPTMASMAKRAVDAAGVTKRVVAVDLNKLPGLEAKGIESIACDMMNLDEVRALPQVENVVFMVGRKFGSTGGEHLTWAINVIVPYHVAGTFLDSRIVAFSTGCVYPVVHVSTGGSTEEMPPAPVGEYAMSALGRERMFDFHSIEKGQKVVQLRLNYAVELRYGVLFDIGTSVMEGKPVDITTGYANVIWQGDACNQVLQSLSLADSPPAILNVTGPETFSIRDVAARFGELMGKEVSFTGEENGRGYLNNASRANALFGNPRVPLDRIVELTAAWIEKGGESLGKPTHFETQDGKY